MTDIVALHAWAVEHQHELVFTLPLHEDSTVGVDGFLIDETQYKVKDNHKITLRSDFLDREMTFYIRDLRLAMRENMHLYSVSVY